jgi:hypothetical protein
MLRAFNLSARRAAATAARQPLTAATALAPCPRITTAARPLSILSKLQKREARRRVAEAEILEKKLRGRATPPPPPFPFGHSPSFGSMR